jgi:Uncharacterized protein conserved in bacteria (DUF2188)
MPCPQESTISSKKTTLENFRSRPGAERASGIFDTQREATARAKELNPNDKPDVERVRRTSGGNPDKRRSSRR